MAGGERRIGGCYKVHPVSAAVIKHTAKHIDLVEETVSFTNGCHICCFHTMATNCGGAAVGHGHSHDRTVYIECIKSVAVWQVCAIDCYVFDRLVTTGCTISTGTF